MKDLIGHAELGLNHVQIIVRGMYKVAMSDNVHATELVMIRGFYNSCVEDKAGLTEFDQVIAQPFDGTEAREILSAAELRRALLHSCLFLAYADGKYSAAEKKTVAEIARAVGVDAATLGSIEDSVRDQLMQKIARIRNVDALKRVATEVQ